MRVKYLTKELLEEAVRQGEKIRANQRVKIQGIEKLPDDLKYPVVWHTLHERGGAITRGSVEVRMMVAVGPDEDHLKTVLLDVPVNFFNDLPEAEAGGD